MKIKALSLILVVAMVAVIFAGCGNAAASASEVSAPASAEAASAAVEEAAPAAEEAAAPAETAAEPASAEEPAAEPVSAAEPEVEALPTYAYPVEADDTTVSMFISFPGNLSSYMASFNDHPGFQILQEQTGVTIEFNEASMENAAQQFELMAASDDFTDIVSGYGDMYTGGLAAAYEQDMIYDLTDYLADYAPDYLNLVNSSESYQNNIYEADGTTLAIYGLYLYDYTSVTSGLLIRQDWLDELSLDTPVTYDDWYNVLSAFKSEKDATLLLPSGGESRGAVYAGGYGTAGYAADERMSAQHFFQVDGVVTSSLIDDNYRDYLTMLNQWYNEGLLYKDFYSLTERGASDPIITGGEIGIFDTKVDYITKYESADATGTMKLAGITDPVKEAGEKNGFGTYVTTKGSVSVTTACENPEVAVALLNYCFTEDGIILANYGEEGVSYELDADGNPVFTDLILHNEDSELQFGNVTRLYLLDEAMPTLYDQTRELQAYSEAEREAVTTWSDGTSAVYTMPDVTLSAEDNEEFSAKLVDIETYASESITKFIIGDKSLDEWDDFVATMKELGIERCIEIYQEALDAQA